jgi:hypothetical protein
MDAGAPGRRGADAGAGLANGGSAGEAGGPKPSGSDTADPAGGPPDSGDAHGGTGGGGTGDGSVASGGAAGGGLGGLSGEGGAGGTAVPPVSDGGRDAGTDGVAGSGGMDGSAGTGGTDAGPRATMCTISTADSEGATLCFCQGALTVDGDTLYRQSYGIEVFDISAPGAPMLLDTIEETGVSDGDVVVFDGHLVSATNVFLTLNVYSLADPRAPTPAGTMMLPASDERSTTSTELATHDGVLAVAYQNGDTTSVIQILSLDTVGNPSIERSIDVDGLITSMTLAVGVAHILVDIGSGDNRRQELRQIDLSDGLVVATFDTTAAGISADNVREWGGASFLTARPSPPLAVVQWSGSNGSVIGRWEDPDVTQAASLEFMASGLLVVGSGSGGVGGRVSLLDVFDITDPTLLGFGEAFRVEHLAVGDDAIYASGNDSLHALTPVCE